MATLAPQWQAIPMPGVHSPLGTPWFRPLVVPGQPVLIAGGPLQVDVFKIFQSQRLWFSVRAHVWITGFDVSATTLYLQDGPVLAAWDLVRGGCLAAINLVAGERWAAERKGDEPPDSLYAVPDDLAAAQTALVDARQIDHWARFAEEVEGALEAYARDASDTGPDPKFEPNGIETLSAFLRQYLGGENPPPDSVAAAHRALANAEANAAPLVISSPAVRKDPLGGESGGAVFSLGLDGTLYALDAELNLTSEIEREAPARAQLALAEPLPSSGTASCLLFWVSTDGSVVGADGSDVESLTPLRPWAGTGAPDPDKLLPLRFADGLLWGGGILGAEFLAFPPTPGSKPVLTSATSTGGGWRDYEVIESDKLAIVTNGTESRLVAYAADARQRDRWGTRYARAGSWSIADTGTGRDAKPPGARLTFEIDKSAASAATTLGYRVLLANTIDSADPSLTSVFPPPAHQLDGGELTAGSLGIIDRVGRVRSAPVVSHNSLFCVVSSTTVAEQMEAWFVKDGSYPARTFLRQIQRQGRTLSAFPAAFAHIALPTLAGTDALVAYDVGPIAAAVAPKAKQELDAIADIAEPIQIRVSKSVFKYQTGVPPEFDLVTNTPLTLLLRRYGSGGNITVNATTDGDAILRIDSRYGRAWATIDPESIREWGRHVNPQRLDSLEYRTINELGIAVTLYGETTKL